MWLYKVNKWPLKVAESAFFTMFNPNVSVYLPSCLFAEQRVPWASNLGKPAYFHLDPNTLVNVNQVGLSGRSMQTWERIHSVPPRDSSMTRVYYSTGRAGVCWGAAMNCKCETTYLPAMQRPWCIIAHLQNRHTTDKKNPEFAPKTDMIRILKDSSWIRACSFSPKGGYRRTFYVTPGIQPDLSLCCVEGNKNVIFVAFHLVFVWCLTFDQGYTVLQIRVVRHDASLLCGGDAQTPDGEVWCSPSFPSSLSLSSRRLLSFLWGFQKLSKNLYQPRAVIVKKFWLCVLRVNFCSTYRLHWCVHAVCKGASEMFTWSHEGNDEPGFVHRLQN